MPLSASIALALMGQTAAAATSTVYYKPASGWANTYIHYGINGSWTAVPGVAMDAATCSGWKVKTVELGTASSFAVTFNNGSGSWDNKNGANYALASGIVQVNAGLVSGGSPCAADVTPPTVPAAVTKGTVTDTTIALSWTASVDNVGVVAYDIYRNGVLAGTSASTTFSDTGLTGATDYIYTVKARDAAGASSAASTALTVRTATTVANSAVVYYYTKTRAWPSVNIHYGLNGTWTASPGLAMNETACTDWVSKTVNLGSLSSMAAVFNNGSGVWDNNSNANYAITAGLTTVKNGVVSSNAASPCVVVPPDTTAPSVPLSPAATATNTTIALSWSASTDNIAVSGYEVSRTDPNLLSTVFTSASNQFSDTGLSAHSVYTYSIKAFDAAGNKSAASSAVSAETGDAPVASSGTPLGTDMREESIYFVMTARFFDGDSSNNRGGSLHTSSGNIAYDDPMFRGDFKGLIERLDYIKALGFSAIWITPVTLNRSDYDFHGYHTYDFNQIDGRLESPGATYQDLINSAHSKGIKIIQDVVFNHSSRWGAKGLFTPKVFGIRDTKWSSYYDVPNPAFTYDGISIEPNSGRNYYNGDIWSTAEPAGNTCRNWGVATATGFNCQWPGATTGMFPAKYYHNCWIGNWEGEDSRSCWLHEDLADFNTENAEVQQYLLNAYNRFIDMGVDGFRIDTAVHVPRVTWNRRFLPQLKAHSAAKHGAKGQNFYMVGEVGAFVNDKWNRGSVNHSAQFFTWKERKEYVADDVQAALDQFNYENNLGTGGQPTSTNAFLNGNNYHTPDTSQFSGMNIIDMRMHMNFGDANNAFWNGKDSDDSTNDASYNMVYVDAHDFGPNKSPTAYAGGTAAWAENMSLMWTFRGIPTLFQGSEIEFQAGKAIDCGPTCALATTRRAYFGGHLEGSVTASDFGVVGSASGTVASTLSNNLVKHVQRLNMIRRKIPALQKGQYSTEGVSGNMAYKRRYTSGSVDSFALISLSSGATFNGIPNGTYKDAVTGDVKTVTGGTLTSNVTGQGNARIYVLDLAGNPAPGKIGADGPFLKP
ncbi:alpha-amylase [Oxalobacteraceae bacterium]|nr:alpha-amylase [Oxalobacteraceae bacterium]